MKNRFLIYDPHDRSIDNDQKRLPKNKSLSWGPAFIIEGMMDLLSGEDLLDKKKSYENDPTRW